MKKITRNIFSASLKSNFILFNFSYTAERTKNMKNKSAKTEDEIILDTVKNHAISQQNDLVQVLESLGVEIPQSSLSRRLKKLGIAKINNQYTIIGARPQVLCPILNIKISPPNIIVLHTLPGHANSLAIQLDEKISFDATTPSQKEYDTLCGTIAGDDTVLVLSDGSKKGLEKLKKAILTDFFVEAVESKF